MNVNQLITTTLSPLGLPIEQDIYSGNETKWITYSYADERATLHADDAPQIDTAEIQIHLFVPSKFNYFQLKKQIRSLLFGAGFSYATIVTLLEDNIRHLVFECSVEGKSETEE